MKTIINNHNKNILGRKLSINMSSCNCWNKEACSLNGQCQIWEVVYKGTLPRNQPSYKEKQYFGIADKSFKRCNHNLSFRNEFDKNNIELSNELWQIKMKNYTRKTTWRISRKCVPSVLKVRILLVPFNWPSQPWSRQSRYFLQQSQDYCFHWAC